MSKKAPLYAWQQTVKTNQKKNLQDFLRNDFKKEEFRNRYISNSEIKVIAKKYNLDLSNLTRIINKQNQEFNTFLSSQTDYIYNKDKIKRKFKKDYYNFYKELNMDEKIDAHNKKINTKRAHRSKEYEETLNNSDDPRIQFMKVNYYPDNKPSEYKTNIHKFSDEIVNIITIQTKLQNNIKKIRLCVLYYF